MSGGRVVRIDFDQDAENIYIGSCQRREDGSISCAVCHPVTRDSKIVEGETIDDVLPADLQPKFRIPIRELFRRSDHTADTCRWLFPTAEIVVV